MKLYLVKTAGLLEPWRRPAEAMRLNGVSLLDRLTAQARELGLVVQACDAGELAGLTGEALVCSAASYLSRGLLKAFVAAARGSERSLQCHVQKRALLVFSSTADEASVPLKLFYLRPGQRTDQCVPVTLETPELLRVPSGLPPAILKKPDTFIPVNSLVGVEVDDWSAYLLAGSLANREFTLGSVEALKAFLPQKLLEFLTSRPSLAKRMNRIGRGCRIHPTAVLEGCVVEDGVEIGPYCYLRASWVGKNATVRENSSVKLSSIGAGTFLTTANLFNALIGEDCMIFTQLLVNCVIGDRTFVGGATGFSDFDFFKDWATIDLGEGKRETFHKFLASAVGDDCSIGAGLIFKPGRMIPNRTTVINKNMIDEVPQREGQHLISNQGRLHAIPEAFLKK